MRNSSWGAGPRGRRPGRIAAWAGVLVLAGLAATGRAAEMRAWSDAKGKFKIQAKFVSEEEGKVTLQKPDGTELEIELKKLSAPDQKYIAGLKEADDNPFKPSNADPFKPKARSGGGMGPATPKAAKEDVAEARVVQPDWSSARVVDVNPTREGWDLAVGPPAEDASGKVVARPIAIPPKINFWEKLQGLAISEATRRAVLSYVVDDPKPAGSTRLVMVDLEKGRLLGAARTTGKMDAVAFHDDGTRVLMRRAEWGFGNADRLEVWDLTASGVKKEIRWAPYGDLNGGDRDVKWATFLGDSRIATISGNGKLVVWDAETARPQYYLLAQGGCNPAVSPDRKHVAFTTGKEVAVLDVEAGEVVASQPMPNSPWPTLAFSPSGRRLGCVGFDRLFVWDFARGALYREIPYLGMVVQGQGFFPTDDHVMLGGHQLVDLESQVRLWDYQGNEMVRPVGGVCVFAVSEGHDKPGALVPAKVPQPGVETALKRALADPNFFVLKPGVTVTVDVNGVPDPAEREKARAALEGRLTANGLRVGPSGALTLTAGVEPGKDRDITYRTFGRGFQVKTYRFKEQVSRVKLVYQGKTAWEGVAINGVPFLVHLKEGQTMDAFLKEHERPNYAYFTNVELPKLLPRPTGSPTIGASRVTTAGVR